MRRTPKSTLFPYTTLFRSDVDLEDDAPQARGQVLADLARKLFPRDRHRCARDVPCIGQSLVDQLPLELARHHVSPGLPQLATLPVAVPTRPTIDVRKQRPLGEREVAVQALQWVAPQKKVDGRPEHLAQLEVDPPHGAVEVDLVIEVQARVEEHVQRLGRMRMQREAAL